jgi:hypothetical protein
MTMGALASDSNQMLLLVFGFGLVFLVAFASIRWHFSRSRRLLEAWAARERYQIIEQRYRSVRRGPFLGSSSRGQAVYHVVVRDQTGVERRGLVRLGGFWRGLHSDQVEVSWE